MNKNHFQAGFSLIEMAIVLTIIGVMASFTLPLFLKQHERSKISLTRENQEAVLYSLAAYLLMAKEIPCPADPNARGADFGWARSTCTYSPQACVGIIPFRTLGLSESLAKDGFKRYMTYAIEPKVRNESLGFEEESGDVFSSFYCSRQGQYKIDDKHLIVRNAHGKSVFQQAGGQGGESLHDFVVVVLVSHGSPGHGAFQEGGSRLQIPNAGAGEITNGRCDLSFVDRPYSTKKGHCFRHIVKWVSHKNLPALYGHTPCRVLENR